MICEWERNIGKYGGYQYTFFLVKNNGKIEILTLNYSHWKTGTEELLKSIDLYIGSFEMKQKTYLSKDERQIITAKIIGLKEQVHQDKAQREAQQEAEWERIFSGSMQVMYSVPLV